MRQAINIMIIAKDGWPLEQIIGRPIINFIRRWRFASHEVCGECWHRNQERKTMSAQTQTDILHK